MQAVYTLSCSINNDSTQVSRHKFPACLAQHEHRTAVTNKAHVVPACECCGLGNRPIATVQLHFRYNRNYAVQAMNGSSIQSDEVNDAEVLTHPDVNQHPGFMRQLSSSVDGSHSDMQSMSEQAPGPAEHTQEPHTTHLKGQPATAAPFHVDAWSQSESLPDVATTSASMESGAFSFLHLSCA